MRKNYLFVAILVLVMMLLLAACGGTQAPAEVAEVEEPAESSDAAEAEEEMAEEEMEELVPLEFRLNWTLYGEHAPFFLGVDKGFYEEEGLDVSIVEGSGSSTTVKLIGNGTNNLGYADSATMMRGVSAGVPVKAVAVTFQSSPMSFIYRAETGGPDSIDKLPGTKVAITAGDASLSIFEACLGANDMTMDDVELIQVTNPQAKEVAVLEGTADTFLGYFVDQPLRMEQATGIEMEWAKLVDVCNVNTLSSAVIANNFWAEQNPEVVEKFVRATQRAWQYTQENPEEAAEIFASHAEAFDVPLALEEIEGSLTLMHTPNSEGQPIGWSALEDWQATQQVLEQYAAFKPEDDVTNFFSNDFISEPPYEPPS